jgi:hypothetical protein
MKNKESAAAGVRSLDANAMVAAVSAAPTVMEARRACKMVVLTVLFSGPPSSLVPPQSHAPLGSACWLALIAGAHQTPEWTPAPIELPGTSGDGARATLALKAMVPLLFDQPVIFLDRKLTTVRCFSFPHLVRAGELAHDSPPHLFASAIPPWYAHGATLEKQFAWERSKRSDGSLPPSLAEMESEMRTDPTVDLSRDGLFCATLWMIWRSDNASRAVSHRWLRAISRGALNDKVSFAWAASVVPSFRKRCTSHYSYIYSSDKKCRASANASEAVSGSGHSGAVTQPAAAASAHDHGEAAAWRPPHTVERLSRRYGGRANSTNARRHGGASKDPESGARRAHSFRPAATSRDAAARDVETGHRIGRPHHSTRSHRELPQTPSSTTGSRSSPAGAGSSTLTPHAPSAAAPLDWQTITIVIPPLTSVAVLIPSAMLFLWAILCASWCMM